MVSRLRITKTEGALSEAKQNEPDEFTRPDFEQALDKAFPIHQSGAETTIKALEAGDRGVPLEDVKSKLARDR